jgi:Protein of unknown function (DUF2752)
MTYAAVSGVGLASRLSRPIVAAAAGALAVTAVVLRDPHVSGSWGVCPFLALTGFYCPACGGLRAVNDLAQGRLAAAVDSNLLVVAMVTYAALVWGAWTHARIRGTQFAYRRWLSPALMAALVVIAVVFAVLRNLPAGSWLAP